MPQRPSLEDRLATLEGLRADLPAPEAIEQLRKAIAAKSNHVAARAASLAGEAGLSQLAPDLLKAFDRFIDRPVATDKGCAAKTAIVEALDRLECDDWAPYERGIAHVQLEPVYGGKADTAVQLRSHCAMAVARRPHPHKLMLLAGLLADREASARQAAARALGFTEEPAALPLLRHKQLCGDAEPAVIGECLLAMLRVDAQQSVSIVAEAMKRGDAATAELAAVALGESRLAEALPLLIDWWEHTLDQELRRTAMLAMAMLRSEEAIGFLVEQVTDGNAQTARTAIESLGIHRHDRAILDRVRLAAAEREDLDLTELVRQAFQIG